jgi:hypothetical protein
MKLMVLLASLGLASAFLSFRLTALMPPQDVITRLTPKLRAPLRP